MRKRRTKSTLRLVRILLIIFSLPFTVSLATKYVPFIERAYNELTGLKANLVVDLSESKSFVPHWKFLAQGGEEAKGAQLSNLDFKLSKLEPIYIRIDHVYDFYEPVKRNEGGKLVFDWTRLDEEIKIIQGGGARPFLSLSYMPKAISAGSEVDLPNSWDEWKFVVRSTLEHVSGKAGLAIPGVYYEIWNEPDLFGRFKLGGEKDYLKLYYYAERGAREAKNILPFRIGGPATTDLYQNWFINLFNYARDNNLRVDFYSWHKYSKNISDFENDIKDAQKWITNYPKYSNTQFIISESGFNPANDSLYDLKFGAIHTLAMYAATFQKIPMIFTFEIKDGPGPQKLWGRWGILTHENFGPPEEKPRYYALAFLNQMKGKTVGLRGSGTWIKAFATYEKEANLVRLLVVNYDPSAAHKEVVPIAFTNLPFSNFKVRKINFLGKTTEIAVVGNGNYWKTEQIFEPNSAAIFELIGE